MASKVIDFDTFDRHTAALPPPSDDDVSITTDGRRLDTVDKWVDFLVEVGDLTPQAAEEFRANHSRT